MDDKELVQLKKMFETITESIGDQVIKSISLKYDFCDTNDKTFIRPNLTVELSTPIRINKPL